MAIKTMDNIGNCYISAIAAYYRSQYKGNVYHLFISTRNCGLFELPIADVDSLKKVITYNCQSDKM